MPIRTKRGRACVETTPQRASQGRSSRTSTTTRSRPSTPSTPRLPVTTDGAGLAVALAIALGELAEAQAAEHASPSTATTAARRHVQRHVRDLRHRLRAKVGREDERTLVAGLTLDGGLAVRAAVAAGPTVRPYAIRALLDASRLAREHGIESVAALVLLARSARWSALAAHALDRALAEPHPGELVKLAAQAGREARLDLLGAMQLAREVRPAHVPTIDVRAAVERFEREQRERELASGTADDDDEPDGDADDDEPLQRVDVETRSLPGRAAEDAREGHPRALPGGASGMPPGMPLRVPVIRRS